MTPGGPVWSARRGWRALHDYGGIAAEVVAVIVIGFLITTLVAMLNPSLEAVTTGATSDSVRSIPGP